MLTGSLHDIRRHFTRMAVWPVISPWRTYRRRGAGQGGLHGGKDFSHAVAGSLAPGRRLAVLGRTGARAVRAGGRGHRLHHHQHQLASAGRASRERGTVSPAGRDEHSPRGDTASAPQHGRRQSRTSRLLPGPVLRRAQYALDADSVTGPVRQQHEPGSGDHDPGPVRHDEPDVPVRQPAAAGNRIPARAGDREPLIRSRSRSAPA